MTTTTSLPTIVAFDGQTDGGEFGAVQCPHCGADGRYIKFFICADGTRRGAMSGCIKLFPVSPLAGEHAKLMEKERTGRKLNGWDTKILAAVEAVRAGSMTEDEALRIVRTQQASRSEWMAKKGIRR